MIERPVLSGAVPCTGGSWERNNWYFISEVLLMMSLNSSVFCDIVCWSSLALCISSRKYWLISSPAWISAFLSIGFTRFNSSEDICCCWNAVCACLFYLQEKKWTELENNKVNFKVKVVLKKKLHGLEEHVLTIAACAHQERSWKVANFISCWPSIWTPKPWIVGEWNKAKKFCGWSGWLACLGYDRKGTLFVAVAHPSQAHDCRMYAIFFLIKSEEKGALFV